MEAVVGAADSEKSATLTVIASEDVCVPLLPVTVKLSMFPATPPRPLTVSTLFCPTAMLGGLKEQAAGALPAQLKLIFVVKLN
jgi:hypothetical protein